MAAIVVGRERHAVVRAGAVSLVLLGGRVCACRSLHGRLMVVLRAVHAGRLTWVVHLITMMCAVGVQVARLRCHLRVDRWIADGDSGGQAVVRAPWADRERRDMDGGRQPQVGGCAVVTDAAPPLGAAGVIWDGLVCTGLARKVAGGVGVAMRRWRMDGGMGGGWGRAG